MTESAHLPFDALNTALKAAGEDTRLRILALLAEAELTVSDLTANSAPVAAAHLAPSQAAGRGRAWSSASARAPGRSSAWPSAARRADLARTLVARLDPADPIVARDRERLAAVRAARAAAAQDYFRAHAAQWDRIRKLHVADEAVEAAIARRARRSGRSARCSISAPAPAACWKCSARSIERGLGIDLSLDMLLLARARLERAGLRHCSVRQGDIYDLAVPARFVRRRHHPSGAALPRRRRARDPRGGARAGAVRPAAGGRFRAARSRIPARGARASPARLCRRDGGAMAGGGRPRHDDASRACRRSRAPTARSRCRSGSRAIRACGSPTTCGRWRDGIVAYPRVVRVLSAQDRGDGAHAVGGDRAARAARAEFRLGDLRRRRLDARAHALRPCGASSTRPRSMPAAHLTCVAATRAEVDAVIAALSRRRRAPHRGAARRSDRRRRRTVRAASGRLSECRRPCRRHQAHRRLRGLGLGLSGEASRTARTVEADIDMLQAKVDAGATPRHDAVLLRERPLFPLSRPGARRAASTFRSCRASCRCRTSSRRRISPSAAAPPCRAGSPSASTASTTTSRHGS